MAIPLNIKTSGLKIDININRKNYKKLKLKKAIISYMYVATTIITQ